MTVYMLYSKTNGHKDAYEQHFHTRKEAEKMRRKKEDVILLKRPGMFGRVIPAEPAKQLALF